MAAPVNSTPSTSTTNYNVPQVPSPTTIVSTAAPIIAATPPASAASIPSISTLRWQIKGLNESIQSWLNSIDEGIPVTESIEKDREHLNNCIQKRDKLLKQIQAAGTTAAPSAITASATSTAVSVDESNTKKQADKPTAMQVFQFLDELEDFQVKRICFIFFNQFGILIKNQNDFDEDTFNPDDGIPQTMHAGFFGKNQLQDKSDFFDKRLEKQVGEVLANFKYELIRNVMPNVELTCFINERLADQFTQVSCETLRFKVFRQKAEEVAAITKLGKDFTEIIAELATVDPFEVSNNHPMRFCLIDKDND